MRKDLVIDLDEDRGFDAGETVVIEHDAVVAKGGALDIVNEDIEPDDKLPADAVLNDDGSVTLPLKFPRSVMSKKDGKVSEKRFESLTLHRLTGADMRAIGAASDEMTVVVSFSRATRINQAVMNVLFDKLDMADINAAGQVINHFLGSGRKTGR